MKSVMRASSPWLLLVILTIPTEGLASDLHAKASNGVAGIAAKEASQNFPVALFSSEGLGAFPQVPAWEVIEVVVVDGDAVPAVIETSGNATLPAKQGQTQPLRRQLLRLHPAAAQYQKLLYQSLLASSFLQKQTLSGPAAMAKCLQRLTKKKVYSTFIKLLSSSGYLATLRQSIQTLPVTILAPQDSAFKALPASYKAQLRDTTVATKFLMYHTLKQVWPYGAILHFIPSPYDTMLGNWAWRQKPAPGKKTVSFGPVQSTPVYQQSPVVDKNPSGIDLRLVVVQGITRCMLPNGIFS